MRRHRLAGGESNREECNIAINALMYVESVCALPRLLILGIADVARIDYLVMGAAIIIGVNMAITL